VRLICDVVFYNSLCHLVLVLFSAIIGIDSSKSIYLVLGLLNEDEEIMRLYFLSKEKNLLTADERIHFILLNKKIHHRVCELADYGSDGEDKIKIQNAQTYEGKYNAFFSCAQFRDNSHCCLTF